MASITTYLPHSDIPVEVEYAVTGSDNVTYAAAYIDGVELPADLLFFKDEHGNQTRLSDYFSFKLQDMASVCLMAAE